MFHIGVDPDQAARAAWVDAIGALAERHRVRRATEDGARSPLTHDRRPVPRGAGASCRTVDPCMKERLATT